jgi:hypothetical protein
VFKTSQILNRQKIIFSLHALPVFLTLLYLRQLFFRNFQSAQHKPVKGVVGNMCRLLFSGLFLWAHLTAMAQESFVVQLPEVEIYADRVLRGDADTYGLGDWRCKFSVTLDSTGLLLKGYISFTEKAHDFTTIVGEYRQRIELGELKRCRSCNVTLAGNEGKVSGSNIGARGYRWFSGEKLIRRARIQTDVFGSDAGQIGGAIQFAPLQVLVDCRLAAQWQR